MSHVVLLGDSIFDNATYVPGEPDVVRQLRTKLPRSWKASLCAVDGSCARDVEGQLGSVPDDASHLIVSAGGNDALPYIDIFHQPAESVGEVVAKFAEISEQFARDYHSMVDAVLGRGVPVALCTIYDGRFDDPAEQRLCSTALTVFNDVITRAAFTSALPLIDLRLVCSDRADYANPIEPSAKGGDKIATIIAQLVTGYSDARRSQVFANVGLQCQT
ncbi:SGNH/GDSL hydrolase family protein [Pseudorhodoplanes sp.]|uniref:SGNH/GDSL hydrolase family protein n=1 Tax=Pseudorhodoplanes sp. TaxID=1934341 RepID=UPI003D11098C